MYQLNFNKEGSKGVSFRNMETSKKKTYERDYSSLNQTRRTIDRILEEKALEKELKDFCF